MRPSCLIACLPTADLKVCTRRTSRSRALILVAWACLLWGSHPLGAQDSDGEQSLVGHAAAINSVIYSPDGSLVATASSDQLIKLWQTANGRELRTLQGHEGQVLCLAISPDNRTLVSGAADNTLRLWDVPRSDPLHAFEGHTQPVAHVVVAPGGRMAVTGGADRSLRLWDLEENKIAALWEGHAAEVTRIAYRPDKNEVASGDAEGSILLWNVLTGEPLTSVGAHLGKVTGLTYHPNNQQLVSTGTDGLLQVWQLPIRSPRVLGEHPAEVSAVAVTGDSQSAVLAAGEQLQVFALASGELQRELEGLPASATSVAISPNNALVAAADMQGAIRLWNLSDGADAGLLEGHAEGVRDVAFHSDNVRLATAGEDGTLRLWRRPEPPLPLAGHTADVLATAADPQGQFVVTSAADNQVRVFNAQNGQALRQLEGHEAPVGILEIASVGNQILSGDALGEIRLWKADDGVAVGRVGAHAGPVTAAAYGPEGKTLVTAGDDGTLKAWPLPLPEPQSLEGHAEAVSAVAMAPDAAFVVTGGAGKSVRMFRSETGELLRTLEGQTEAVTSLAVLPRPNDSLVASGAADGSIRLWHAEDGAPWNGPGKTAPEAENAAPKEELQENLAPAALLGHRDRVRQIAHHAESGTIATAGADGTIRLWRLPTAPTQLAQTASPITRYIVSPDGTKAACGGLLQERPAVFLYDLQTGQLIHTLLGHAEAVTALAFNADGTQLATGSSDQTARVWNLDDDKFPEVRHVALPAAVTAVAFDGDSTHWFAGADNVIRQWSLAVAEGENEEEVRSYSGHSAAVSRLVVHKETLFSAAADSTVRSWNLETGDVIQSLNHGAAVQALAVSTDGTRVASAGADNAIKLWNVADGAAFATLDGHAASATSLSFDPDNRLLASSSAEGLRLWDVASGQLLQTFPSPDWPVVGIGFGPPVGAAEPAGGLSQFQLAVAGADGGLRLYRPDLLQWLSGHEGGVSGVQFLPDGQSLISAGADHVIRQWDLSEGQPTRSFGGLTEDITAISVTPDGGLLAGASASGEVCLWNLAGEPPAAGQPLPAMKTLQYPAPVHSVQFSADAGQLAIVGDNQVVYVWDVKHQQQRQRFFGHTDAVHSVAISSDGRTLVSGSVDKTARIWNVSADIIRSDSEAVVRDLAFTPDGRTLIAAGDQPQLSLWPVDPMQQLGEPKQLPSADQIPEPWTAAPQRRVTVHPTLNQLAVLDDAGRVTRWDLAEHQLLDVIPAVPVDEAGAEEAGAEEADAEEVGTEEAVGAIAYGEGGETLAIGTSDQVRIYDVGTARQLELFRQGASVTSLSFTTDGRLAVAHRGPEAGATLRTRALEKWWIAHEGAATAVAFSPDGTTLVSCGADPTAKLWSVEDATQLRSYGGSAENLTDVAITPDGQQVIAASADRFVRVWPFAPPAPQEEAAAPEAAEQPPVQIEPRLQLEHPAVVRRLSISADSTKLVTAGEDSVARLWDLALGRQVQRWKTHEQAVSAVALAADNKTIITGSADKTARVMEIGILRTVAAHEQAVQDLALYNNGAQVATAADGSVRLWNAGDGQMVREFSGSAAFTQLAVKSDNTELVAADADERVHLWNLADGSEITQFKVPAAVNSLQYATDNQKIVAAMSDGSLRFYAPEDGTLLYQLDSQQPLTTAAFTDDSRRVVTGGAEGAVQLWAYASPQAVRTLNGHGGNVYSVAFSPDGTKIASCSADQTIRLWDPTTGNQLSQLTGHQGPVYSVAFSPDGALIVSAGADNSVRLWDVVGGRQLKQLPAGEASLYSVSFHPDGRLVAAAGLDKKIYVYDALAGTLESTLEGHDDYIYRVSYNASGNRLLSCGYGGNIVVWNAANGQKLFEQVVSQVANFADYAPLNDRIVVASGDGRARFLEIPSNAR